MGLKESLVGDYNYQALCMPQLPWKKERPNMTFYPKEEKLPILLSMVMGLQHAFAMVGGLITPPYVVFRFSVNFLDTDLQQYAISAALITSGIFTIMNVLQLSIPFSEKIFGREIVVGSGILSVVGTSFTFLPIFEAAIAQMRADGVDAEDAYGKMLGTVMVCSFLEVLLSFVPHKRLRQTFPPLISGITIILIGVALTGTGMKYWGGGVVCAEMGWKEHSQAVAAGVSPIPGPTCTNGEVALGYGSPEFIGLGFSVMAGLVFIECFGSTFMKNCNVVIALCFGYMVAAASDKDGSDYVTDTNIKSADTITFLWTQTFKIGIYGPAILPLLVGFLVSSVESIGDIGATYEASELDVNGPEFPKSVQGGLLADGISSFMASLFTTMPNTTFSQNNGVIAMTKCASRRAGYACGGWLIFMGIVGKVAGIITSIPDSVLGGMTIFLFSNVMVSGIKILSQVDLNSRRARFILALSLALGVGVTVWPFAFLDRRASPYTANFWPCNDCGDNMKGLRNGVVIFLSTGYCIGTVTAVILNCILPADVMVDGSMHDKVLSPVVVANQDPPKEANGPITTAPKYSAA